MNKKLVGSLTSLTNGAVLGIAQTGQQVTNKLFQNFVTLVSKTHSW